MTVLLVLFTFAIFLLIDYFRTRHMVARLAKQVPKIIPTTTSHLPARIVAGFEVPEIFRYHPGHSWALSESPNLVRVGIDDFASKLTGKMESITLPARGQWIRQGQKMCTVHRDGCTADIASPIEGTVSDVNDAAVSDPKLVLRDPYGEGWLLTVQAPDVKTSFRNLLNGTLARYWMEEAANRLRFRMTEAVGALAQDGGMAVDDLAAQIPDSNWTALAKEFFLS
jgi:glycine cleavage system H lipoate-binding protein